MSYTLWFVHFTLCKFCLKNDFAVTGGMRTKVNLGSTGPEAFTNYKYEIRFESKYFFRMKKEIKQNTNFKKLSNTTTITKSRKIIKLFFLIAWHISITFFWGEGASSLITSSYYILYNHFSIQRRENIQSCL